MICTGAGNAGMAQTTWDGCAYFIPLRLRCANSRPGDIERYPAASSRVSITITLVSMETDYFTNPRRFPKNAPGPFYTTGEPDSQQVWCGDCLACDAPEAVAPYLLAKLDNDNSDTYYVRQPETAEERESACGAMVVCCVAALRYGGRDRTIIARLQNSPEFCDYVVDEHDLLVPSLDDNGELLPFAKRLLDKQHRKCWGNISEVPVSLAIIGLAQCVIGMLAFWGIRDFFFADDDNNPSRYQYLHYAYLGLLPSLSLTVVFLHILRQADGCLRTVEKIAFATCCLLPVAAFIVAVLAR